MMFLPIKEIHYKKKIIVHTNVVQVNPFLTSLSFHATPVVNLTSRPCISIYNVHVYKNIYTLDLHVSYSGTVSQK